MLEEIINYYKQDVPNHKPLTKAQLAQHIIENEGKGDAICAAIEGGSITCLTLLLNQIKIAGHFQHNEQKIDYLFKAIQTNQASMVNLLLKDMSDETIKTLKMSLSAIEKTDLLILNTLKKGGFSFSSKGEKIIAQKEGHPQNYVVSLDIGLAKFTDFCKAILFKTPSLKHSRKFCGLFGNGKKHIKGEIDQSFGAYQTQVKF